MATKAILTQAGDGTAIPAGMVGQILESIGSNNVEKASSLGADVVFDSVGAPSVTLGVGTWELFGASALRGENAADIKTIVFYDGSADFGGGTVEGIGNTGLRTPACCMGSINVTSGSKTIYLKGKRNGASTIVVGHTGANLSCGYIRARRIA